jgi:hypothetical protein
LMEFNTIYSKISVISWRSVLIGGGNRSIRRKPPTCRKSLTSLSHNVISSTPRLIDIDCTGRYIKLVKIFSEINISVDFTHAFKFKSFTNMFMWITTH